MGNSKSTKIDYIPKKTLKLNLDIILANTSYIFTKNKLIIGGFKIDSNNKIEVNIKDDNLILNFSNCEYDRYSERINIELKSKEYSGILIITICNNLYKGLIKYEKEKIYAHDDPNIYILNFYITKI